MRSLQADIAILQRREVAGRHDLQHTIEVEERIEPNELLHNTASVNIEVEDSGQPTDFGSEIDSEIFISAQDNYIIPTSQDHKSEESRRSHEGAWYLY